MDKAAKLLFSAGSVGLVPHLNPDWDAMGSAFALCEALTAAGVRCGVITDEPLPFKFAFANKETVIFDGALDYELLCALDCPTPERLGRRREAFEKHPNTLCIDHHFTNTFFAHYTVLDSEISSVGEMIYKLLAIAGVPVTPSEASWLFCAISSDSGGLRYSNTSPETFEICAALSRLGADTAALSDALYDSCSLAQFKLMGAVINSLELFCGGKAAVCTLTLEDLKRTGGGDSEASDLVNLPRSIANAEVGILMREAAKDEIRISFRSKSKIDVSAMAGRFGGGGHIRAAGATVKGSLAQVKEKLAALLAETDHENA